MKLGTQILLDPAPAAGAAGGGAPETFTLAERNSFAEAARKQEKDKLYPEMEALRGKVTELNGVITALTADKTALTGQVTTLQGQIEAFGKVNVKGQELDVAALIAEVTEKASKATAAAYEPRLAALDTEVSTVKKHNRKMTLEQYTASKIREAGGENALILQMVRGETEAEIDAAIEVSKATFEQVRTKVGGTAPTIPNPNEARVAAPPVLPNGQPAAPGGGGAGGAGVPNVREMSLKDYVTNRQSIKQKAAQRYGVA